jgi:predicted small secreted protein
MKKLVTAIFVIAMIFTLTACEKVSGMETEVETPEQAITNIVSAIKEVNAEELTRYGAKELIGRTDELNNKRNKKIFEMLEFNIKSIEENEDSAIVKVEFKTKNLTSIPQDYVDQSAMLTVENNNLGENKLDDVAMKQKYSDILVDLIDKCEYTEFKEVVDVHLTKENNNWKLNLDMKFHNAIYGNMIVSQNTVFWPKVNIEEYVENKTDSEDQNMIDENKSVYIKNENITTRNLKVIK